MYKDFTSLDPAEEQAFVVYEQRMQTTSKKALNLGMIVSGVFGLIVILIYATGEKPKSRFAEEGAGDTQELGAEESKREAPKPDPTPAAAPETETAPAEGGAEAAAEGGEAAAPAGEAPPPPPGATKAPPTALTK